MWYIVVSSMKEMKASAAMSADDRSATSVTPCWEKTVVRKALITQVLSVKFPQVHSIPKLMASLPLPCFRLR